MGPMSGETNCQQEWHEDDAASNPESPGEEAGGDADEDELPRLDRRFLNHTPRLDVIKSGFGRP